MTGRPQPPGHNALPLENWPLEDRAALERASIGGTPFSRTGRAARWRPASRHSLTGTYGRWLGFLQRGGCILEEEGAPERVTPERVESYTRFLMGRCAPVTVASYLGQLHMFLKHVWPDRDWRWLCEMQAQQHRLADPVRIKAARIVPQHELVELGLDLMAQAEAMPLHDALAAGPRHPALIFRDGLMIATLAMRPLRQRNFLGLRLHRHLRLEPEGWVIAIPAAETKTHQSLNMPFPVSLEGALQLYLEVYRPLLLTMRGPSNPKHPVALAGSHLWVSRCGTAITPAAFAKLLERHTIPRFGHYVNPHLFRDCVASSVADQHPEQLRIAADLLGHRSLQTTQRHYIVANQRAALRRVAALIEGHRKGNRRRATPTGPDGA
jgi:integrase/recombinase XerD